MYETKQTKRRFIEIDEFLMLHRFSDTKAAMALSINRATMAKLRRKTVDCIILDMGEDYFGQRFKAMREL